MTYGAAEMADLMHFDDFCARIFADTRMPPGTRELALTLGWTSLRDPQRSDGDATTRRARLILGRKGDGSRLRDLMAADRPRYERPRAWSGPCDGPRLRAYRPRDDSEYEKVKAERRESRCGASARDHVYEYDMVTGQVTRTYWYCPRHKDDAQRVRTQVQQRGAPPPPIPNVGGLLPCYFEHKAMEEAYRWACPRWEPPYHGICADDWPIPGQVLVPKRPRLALVVSN